MCVNKTLNDINTMRPDVYLVSRWWCASVRLRPIGVAMVDGEMRTARRDNDNNTHPGAAGRWHNMRAKYSTGT